MSKTTKTIVLIATAIICLLTAYFLGIWTMAHRGTTVTETKYDTLYVKSVDTLYVSKQEIRYKDVFIVDTVYVKDTVLTVEQKVYEDTISTIYISGIEPNIDSIEYRIPRDTTFIFKETTITQTKKRGGGQFFGIGVGAGYGIPLTADFAHPTPYIGVQITYGWGYHW